MTLIRALTRLSISVVVLLCLHGAANAGPFTFVSATNVAPPPPGTGIHGIARVGNQWFVSNFNNGWNIYDSLFNQVGSVFTSGLGQTRGMAYDSNSGFVYVGDINTSTIHKVTTSGTIVSSFNTGLSGLNAVAFDPNSGHLFAANFNGQVREFTTSGTQLSFFVTGQNWTGAAFDSVGGTLLLLNNNDQVLEYSTAGSLIGTPLPGDAEAGNGQGLAYDSATGVLHVTGQNGGIAIWQRAVASSVPLPGTLALLGIGLLCLRRVLRAHAN